MTECSNMQNITIPRLPNPIHDVLHTVVFAGLAYVPSVMPARLSPTTSRQANFGLRGDKPRVYVTKRTHKEGEKPNDLLSYLTAKKNAKERIMSQLAVVCRLQHSSARISWAESAQRRRTRVPFTNEERQTAKLQNFWAHNNWKWTRLVVVIGCTQYKNPTQIRTSL